MTSSPLSWAIRPLVHDDVYTNRDEYLAYFHQAALKAITRRSMSTVMLGQRRMGKTEIFKRVVNRLFFDQTAYTDIHASVVPVYYIFSDTRPDRRVFAEEYVETLIRWYAAFRLRQPAVISRQSVASQYLQEWVTQHLAAISPAFQEALDLYAAIRQNTINRPDKAALLLPRTVSDWEDSTIVMFLDEFQNTRLPQYNFDLVGLMQEAVESPTCPHFVTGSAMSILAGEILGRGALFGRFESEPIGPLTDYWGAELAMKAAHHYHAAISEDLAPILSARCGGNPFYITAVVRQSVKQNKPLTDEARINEILAVDLSSGFIWGELNDQVSRWIERLNEYGITKWVLNLSALEENDRIDLARIRTELKEREGSTVSLETIRDILIKLSRGDLLDYMELGNWFRKVSDPILLEFLKVWGRIAVEGRALETVQQELLLQHEKLKDRIANHLGYLGEVYLSQILWTSQHQILPGHFFHSDTDVQIPGRFVYIWHRTRLATGPDMEIDVEAAAGKEMWICESKWWQTRKAGVAEVQSLLKKGRLLREKSGEGLKILRLWFFAHNGFTRGAEKLMQQEGVFWSNAQDLDGLLDHVGLKRLPVLAEP